MSNNGAVYLLVTGAEHDVLRLSQRTSYYANWIEQRRSAPRQSHLVSVWANERAQFLDEGRATGVTVEEVIGEGEDEEYVLLVGAPGTGWEEA